MVSPPHKNIIILLLAAGRSSRTAPAHKLMARNSAGQTMLASAVQTALNSTATEVVVILPPDRPELTQLLQTAFPATARLSLCVAHNAAQGLSASLRAGVSYAEERSADAALVCLADMPLVSTALINQLIATQSAAFPPPAAAPALGARLGNPVIWHKTQFTALKAVTGDKGGRTILADLGEQVCTLPADPAELVDFDTPERLATFARL